MGGPPGGGGAPPPPPEAGPHPPTTTSLIDQRVQAALGRLAAQTASTGTVLLLAAAATRATATAGADAWWELDLAAGTATAGTGHRSAADTDWSITGSIDVWERLIAGTANLGAAFRRGELRYSAQDGVPAGSSAADERVALIAGLLGLGPQR